MKSSSLFVVSNRIINAQRNSSLYKRKAEDEDKIEKDNDGSLGKGWFHLKVMFHRYTTFTNRHVLQPMNMTEELKRDLQIIQMRNYLDPKR